MFYVERSVKLNIMPTNYAYSSEWFNKFYLYTHNFFLIEKFHMPR